MKRTPRQLYEKLKSHLAVVPTGRYDILLPHGLREFSMGDGLLVLRWSPKVPKGGHRPSFEEFCKAYRLEATA